MCLVLSWCGVHFSSHLPGVQYIPVGANTNQNQIPGKLNMSLLARFVLGSKFVVVGLRNQSKCLALQLYRVKSTLH